MALHVTPTNADDHAEAGCIAKEIRAATDASGEFASLIRAVLSSFQTMGGRVLLRLDHAIPKDSSEIMSVASRPSASNHRNPSEAVIWIFDRTSGLEELRKFAERRPWAQSGRLWERSAVPAQHESVR